MIYNDHHGNCALLLLGAAHNRRGTVKGIEKTQTTDSMRNSAVYYINKSGPDQNMPICDCGSKSLSNGVACRVLWFCAACLSCAESLFPRIWLHSPSTPSPFSGRKDRWRDFLMRRCIFCMHPQCVRSFSFLLLTVWGRKMPSTHENKRTFQYDTVMAFNHVLNRWLLTLLI